MPKYQVQYKNNSKTINIILETKSHVEIIDLFKDLINAELTEIREIVYENNKYPKDDGKYIKYMKVTFRDNDISRTIKIPKIKQNISDKEFEKYCLQFLKFKRKTPKFIKISTQF